MPIQFNHVLIFAHDKHESATFLTTLFGLPEPTPAGFFLAVDLDNAVTLHYGEPGVDFLSQHYAFLVSDADFDAILGRIRDPLHGALGRSTPAASGQDQHSPRWARRVFS